MKKLAKAEYGSVVLEEFDTEIIPSDIISAYFEMKKKTHNVSYMMTGVEYLVNIMYQMRMYFILII